MGVFLAEDATSTLAPVTSFCPRLDVQDRALDDALESRGSLGIDFLVPATVGVCAAMKSPSAFLSSSIFRGAGAQHLRGGRCPEREQQVLDGDELIRFWRASTNAHVQTDFEFLRDHRKGQALAGKNSRLHMRPAGRKSVSSITHERVLVFACCRTTCSTL